MLPPALLRVSLGVGIVGFLASLAVHVATLVGAAVSEAAFVLHAGVFVAFVPVVFGLVGLAKRRGIGPRDRMATLAFLVGLLRALPTWQKVVLAVLFVYAGVNVGLAFGDGLGAGGSFLRGFSGHWLLFYAVSAVLAAALLREGAAEAHAAR